MATYNDSVYKFTSPIRLFKANDPYYYKVDNIPLKQLEENILWIKDQLETSSLTEFGRSEFTELKPYVNGSDNVVRVKPGRFTTRVNDAYNIVPMQILTQVLGTAIGDMNVWEAKTIIDSAVSSVISNLTGTLASNSLGLNGLVERSLTIPVRDLDSPWPGAETDITTFNTEAFLGILNGNVSSSQVTNWSPIQEFGFAVSWTAETEFIKRWRGIARTSIVNVEEELQLEIPAFDENEFYYIDAAGNKVLIPATQRIDLVFIYSKPIDVSSTTIPKFSNLTPATITKPTLGIVKGAGIGINLNTNNTTPRVLDASRVDADGNQLILPSVGDELATNIGIGSIKGSFPSPDDLINLSPLIMEQLATSSILLAGQAGLPVAYVLVEKDPQLNANNVQVISTNNLIDIRPFFRTTELSYNERSGIAAATPQISLANPVASESYVDLTAKRIYNDLVTRIGSTTSTSTASNNFPRIVGSGYVKGGTRFGVEGVLSEFLRTNFNTGNNTSQQAISQQVVSRYGYPVGTQIPDYPDWDVAEWTKLGNFGAPGAAPNDYINFHLFGPNFNGEAKLPWGVALTASEGSAKIKAYGTDRTIGGNVNPTSQSNVDGTIKGPVCIYFCKKTIKLDRSQIDWASDYHVNVQLWNCAPLSSRAFRNTNGIEAAGNASVWVDKRSDEFTIFVSWVAADQFNRISSNISLESGDTQFRPDLARNEGDRFAGFSVINNDMVNTNYIHANVPGEIPGGVAIYPTVSFQVIGIPGAPQYQAQVSGQNPLLVLG